MRAGTGPGIGIGKAVGNETLTIITTVELRETEISRETGMMIEPRTRQVVGGDRAIGIEREMIRTMTVDTIPMIMAEGVWGGSITTKKEEGINGSPEQERKTRVPRVSRRRYTDSNPHRPR